MSDADLDRRAEALRQEAKRETLDRIKAGVSASMSGIEMFAEERWEDVAEGLKEVWRDEARKALK